MDAIEDGRSRNLARPGLGGEDAALAAQLYYLLVLLCRGAALTIVTNAGEQEGLLSWEKLVDHYDPAVAGRQAGQLLSILSWVFSSELQERLELFDREVRRYGAKSGVSVPPILNVGIVLRQMEDGGLKQHLLMNAARFGTDWPASRPS